MPYTTRADNDVITASSHNANCRDQVVSTVTSGTRPSGTEGQEIYETDTDLKKIYNGSWIDLGAVGQWQTYTPTWTQSATITKTLTYVRYNKTGRMVTVNVYLTSTSAGTANNVMIVTAPFTSAVAGSLAVGSGFFFDASTSITYPFITTLATTTNFQFVDSTAAVNIATQIGQTGSAFNLAIASGDIITFTATYESTT